VHAPGGWGGGGDVDRVGRNVGMEGISTGGSAAGLGAKRRVGGVEGTGEAEEEEGREREGSMIVTSN